MNKFSRIFPFALLLNILWLQSCDWKRISGLGDNPSDSVDAPSYCTVEFVDSINSLEATAYQDIKADFPADNDSSEVAQSVLTWLCQEIRQRCVADFNDEPIDSTFKVSGEKELFGEDVVTTYGRKGLQKMEEEVRQLAEDGYAGGYSNNLTIALEEQQNEYLTFTLEHDVYLGGAHGSQYHEGKSFRRQDGKIFSWEMFHKSKMDELRALLKNGLIAFFNQYEENVITTDSALYEHLILIDDPDTPENELSYGLPLPTTQPWITREGIAFIYQEYEITAYAYGRPFIILPFSAIKDCLTEEGLTFIPAE